MRLQWIFVFFLVSCWIKPTAETIGSWDLSSVLSNFIYGHHETVSETDLERSLSRRKRAAATNQYTLDIEISFPDASFAKQIKQFLANLTFPIPTAGNTTIDNISVTTACNQSISNVQCSCESGYIWPTAICSKYIPCPGSGPSSCTCISGGSVPTQYCQQIVGSSVPTVLSLKINEVFTADFNDPTSVIYIKYKTLLETQFQKTYGSLPGFKSANVTRFRPGSVAADYTLVTEPMSSTALADANKNLVNDLTALNISVEPKIKPVVNDNISISVSPNNIFSKDKVFLNCTVKIASYSSVAWYNGSTQLSNTLYKTTPVSNTVQSILTISSASLSDGGTYLCIIENDNASYQTNSTIAVQALSITTLSQNIACDGTQVSVVKCCTSGSSMDFYLTCSINAAITGMTSSSAPCQTYQVTGNEMTCARWKTDTYNCACFTGNGANETLKLPVIYQVTYGATVNSMVNTISEGKSLTLECKCNATSVQAISWILQTSRIDSRYYKSNVTDCTSTLTVPDTTLTVSWNGTYQCSVNTGSTVVTASKDISIVKLIGRSQIIIKPEIGNFLNNSGVDLSCCIDDTTGYSASLQITQGNSMQRYVMTNNGKCFIATYTPNNCAQCENFTANCNITNRLGDYVLSGTMTLKLIKVKNCSKPDGAEGSEATQLCVDTDQLLSGTIYLICLSGNWTQSNTKTNTCVSAALNKIKNQLDSFTSSTSVANVTAALGDLTSAVHTNQNNVSSSVNDILLIVNILQKVEGAVTKVDTPVMTNFLQTVNVIINNPVTWNAMPQKVEQSSALLGSVENFTQKLVITGEVSIRNNSNIQLFGNVISNVNNSYKANFEFDQKKNLTGSVLINQTVLDNFKNDTTIVSVAYATLMDILHTTGNNSSIRGAINSLVITTKVSENKTDFQIGMNFRKDNQTLNNASCVFWNFTINDWDNTGCRPQSIDNTSVNCICDHLTSFSILMSYNYMSYEYNPDPIAERALTFITYIGLGISMLSLVICIMIEATVWKSVTKNKTSYMRHVCIMNIAVTLLMADIWFIIAGAMSEGKKVDACVASTFFTHLFYLCTFFWMLTMGLILFYRLMCVFHDLSKTVMMGISFFLGYGCPIIISVITVAVTQPSQKYTENPKCWLNMNESKAFLAFILPALTILLINFITLFVVIIKVLRPSIGDKPRKEEKSSLNHITKCILILTPLLGLTWGFGIGTMSSTNPGIHGTFAALNSLQGLFILLFGCLLDKKVRDALLSRFSVSRWTSQQTKSSNLSSADPVFPKGAFNLFAKKGVYNISSAQASSSSEMSNSYSLLT